MQLKFCHFGSILAKLTGIMSIISWKILNSTQRSSSDWFLYRVYLTFYDLLTFLL